MRESEKNRVERSKRVCGEYERMQVNYKPKIQVKYTQ